MAVERLKSCDNIVALSQKLGVHRRLLYQWRDQSEAFESEESPPGAPKISRSLSPTFSITITTRIRPTVLGRRAVGVAGGCPWKEFPTMPSGV